jgi:hypothetical protein
MLLLLYLFILLINSFKTLLIYYFGEILDVNDDSYHFPRVRYTVIGPLVLIIER